MSQGVVEVHNGELCFELLGNRSADVSVEVSSSKATKDNATFQAISPHAPSRPSTSQAIHAVEWLSRKARRAVVVCLLKSIPYDHHIQLFISLILLLIGSTG